MRKSDAMKRWKLKIICNSILSMLGIKYRFVFYFSAFKDEYILVRFKKWDKKVDTVKLKTF